MKIEVEELEKGDPGIGCYSKLLHTSAARLPQLPGRLMIVS